MSPEFLNLLCCPGCRGDLRLCSEENSLGEGSLECQSCGAGYPIRHGIPRFVPETSYADSFGLQWTKYKATQLDSRNGATLSQGRFLTETGWDPAWLEGKWILDAGCGAGRFLDVATRYGCQVVGLDLSQAVDAVDSLLADRTNLHLVQGSLFDLPFKEGVFDGVYCIGVLQHTPDPLGGAAALPRVLRKGGRIAVTCYERNRFTLWHGKYILRRLTRRLNPRALLAIVRAMMPILFPATELLFRVPLLGRLAQFAIPVANYVHEKRLGLRQRYEWAILDTFDMLAPAYDDPQREDELRSVLVQQGVVHLRRLPNPGLNMAGSRDG